MEWKFAIEQKYVIRVYDKDLRFTSDLNEHDFLGGYMFTLGELMRSEGNTLARPLHAKSRKRKNNSFLVITGKEVGETRDYLAFRFSAEKLYRDDITERVNPYFKVQVLKEDEQRWEVKWKSESIKNNSSPTWDEAKLPLQVLLNGSKSGNGHDDFNKLLQNSLLRCTLWNYQRKADHEPLGYFDVTI